MCSSDLLTKLIGEPVIDPPGDIRAIVTTVGDEDFAHSLETTPRPRTQRRSLIFYPAILVKRERTLPLRFSGWLPLYWIGSFGLRLKRDWFGGAPDIEENGDQHVAQNIHA